MKYVSVNIKIYRLMGYSGLEALINSMYIHYSVELYLL